MYFSRLFIFDRQNQYLQEEEKNEAVGNLNHKPGLCHKWTKVKFIKTAFHTKQLTLQMCWSGEHFWRTDGLPLSRTPVLLFDAYGVLLIDSWLSSQKYQWDAFYTNLVSMGYLLPVNAIHRAYFVASLRQWEATSKPHVTVNEMIPMMIKNSVVIHSGGSRGGMHVRSRPWIVWHCRTRPTVSAPEEMQTVGIL